MHVTCNAPWRVTTLKERHTISITIQHIIFSACLLQERCLTLSLCSLENFVYVALEFAKSSNNP